MIRLMLSTINEAETTEHVDEEFANMDDLIAFVQHGEYKWTSMVVIVLPATENNNEA